MARGVAPGESATLFRPDVVHNSHAVWTPPIAPLGPPARPQSTADETPGMTPCSGRQDCFVSNKTGTYACFSGE